MRELTIEEYKDQENAWLEKNKEYFSKYIELNKIKNKTCKEKFDGNINEYLKSDEAKEVDKKRDLLKEEYNGYVDHYFDPDFYCVIKTIDDIDKIVESGNTKKWMKESIKDIGRIMTNGSKLIGEYVGIAVALDDYYYMLREEKSGQINWETCVGSIFPYKKPKSFNIVTNGKDYI